MGKLANQVLEYLNTTPSLQLSQDWEDLKKYNQQGPDILDVILNYGAFSLETPLLKISEPSFTETSSVFVDAHLQEQVYTNSELCLAA